MAASFHKSAGQFTIEVTEPHPRWVTIRNLRYGSRRSEESIGGINIEDLHDLQYLVERAIRWVENMDNNERKS